MRNVKENSKEYQITLQIFLAVLYMLKSFPDTVANIFFCKVSEHQGKYEILIQENTVPKLTSLKLTN